MHLQYNPQRCAGHDAIITVEHNRIPLNIPAVKFSYTGWLTEIKPQRYTIQHIPVPAQARTNWEGCGRKGIRRKNWGDDGWRRWRPK